jgi:hypothetical protein
MGNLEPTSCPECLESVDRRRFIRVLGASATALTMGGALAPAVASAQQAAAPAIPKAPRPAEALCRELFGTLSADQKTRLVLPWNSPNRQRLYNAPMNVRIGQTYARAQQELLQRIMRAISSGEEGYTKLSRNGGWDTGGGFGGCGANFFGEVADGRQWAWVFSGHHLTVRCDGDSEPDAAWGGPMYYGHSPDGHSQRNVFNFQTRSVNALFDSLTEAQRRSAVVTMGRPGEGAQSVAFRRSGYPGIRSGDLTADQRRLVETVMRDLLSPYRREDSNEVMQIVGRNGGLERLYFAFYRDAGASDQTRWSFWRIEGPGFVWNYRVLPHVHCYVNVAVRPQA